MEHKPDKRPFQSEEFRSTGTVISDPVDVSKSDSHMDVRFVLLCRYVPHEHDPEKEAQDPDFYAYKRIISVRGSRNYSIPNNVLEGLKKGMHMTVSGKVSGDSEGNPLYLAEEVTSNWRFGTWQRGGSNPEYQESDAPQEREPRPRRVRKRIADDEETSPSAIRRRRGASSSTERATENKVSRPARVRSDRPQQDVIVQVRGDDIEDDFDTMFQIGDSK